MQMQKKMNVMRWGLLLSGIVMIVYGTFRGEAATVFKKAVNICLECIGIG